VNKSRVPKTVIVGVAGGTGSGKTKLSNYLLGALGKRATLISHDWYYHDRGGLSEPERLKLNFDHPKALDTGLFVRHLQDLKNRAAVEAPRYDYATHKRLASTVPAAHADMILVEGLFILHEERIRQLLDLSVFVDVPADVRLLWRIRRDTHERGVPLEETLRIYEKFARPAHERYIQPSARFATTVWTPLTDKTFPARFRRQLQTILS
jgi:uridine kinase